MFYFGYCGKCNYLTADLNGNDLFDTLQDHQIDKHRKVDAEAIHVLRVFLPWGVWLTAKKSASFWEAWRHRKQPAYVLARLSHLVP